MFRNVTNFRTTAQLLRRKGNRKDFKEKKERRKKGKKE
jgi:hypothetical protein